MGPAIGYGVCWEDDVVTRFMTRSARVSGTHGAGLFGRRNEMAMGDGYQLRDLSYGRELNLVLGFRIQVISQIGLKLSSEFHSVR